MYRRSLHAIERRRKPRKRGTARLFVLGAAFAASTASGKVVAPIHAAEPRWAAVGTAGAPEAQDTQQLRFAIQAAPLGDVLAEFERITQVKVVLTEGGIGTKVGPGLSARVREGQASCSKRISFASTSASFSIHARCCGVHQSSANAARPQYTQNSSSCPRCTSWVLASRRYRPSCRCTVAPSLGPPRILNWRWQ